MPSVVAKGDSVTLIADFSGGTGTVSPGNVAISPGTAVRLGPVITAETYTLSVQGNDGKQVQQSVSVGLGPAKATGKIMLGYSTGNTSSLSSFASYLNTVSVDLFNMTSTGTVSGTDASAILATAASQGIHAYACVTNYTTTFDASLAKTTLTTNRSQAISNLLALAQTGFEGINVDFENLTYNANIASVRADLTAFIHDLALRLHDHGFKLIISVPAKSVDDTSTDTWAGPFDYAALGSDVDYLQLMTYDEHGPDWSGPGPVAGLNWVEACLTYSAGIVPSSKLLIGLPAYGYAWQKSPGGAWGPDATGSSFSWKNRPTTNLLWDTTSQSPYADTTTGGIEHQSWFETPQSITAKAALVKAHALGGVSMWALGQEDLDFWQAVMAGPIE